MSTSLARRSPTHRILPRRSPWRLSIFMCVPGIHIIAVECEQKVREIVEGAGLLPRPSV